MIFCDTMVGVLLMFTVVICVCRVDVQGSRSVFHITDEK